MSVIPASVDQMEAITSARRVERRALLLEKAKTGNATKSYPLLFLAIAFIGVLYVGLVSNRSLALAVVGVNAALLTWGLRPIVSRLDAIAELLANDESKQRG